MRVISPGVPECFFDPGAQEAARIRSRYGLEGPYILFVGCIEPRNNVPRLIRAYRQLPGPLRREVGLVIAGLPVIASDRASLPEVVGEGGLPINPESAEELSAAMERIVNSPGLASEIGQRARLRAERFHWRESAQKSLDFFHDVIGRGR